MSTRHAEEFLGALQTDTALRSALDAAKVSAFGQPLVVFAKGHGFEFTLEELTAQVANDGAELTDDMLDRVSGGAGDMSDIAQRTLQDNQQKLGQAAQTMAACCSGPGEIISNLRS